MNAYSVTLSTGNSYLLKFRFMDDLGFEKREILLIVGVFFLMIGLLPFLAPVVAIPVVIGVYFGIKVFVKIRKRQIQIGVGEGICATCGSKIAERRCPNCDKP